jgi:hypothetical protein
MHKCSWSWHDRPFTSSASFSSFVTDRDLSCLGSGVPSRAARNVSGQPRGLFPWNYASSQKLAGQGRKQTDNSCGFRSPDCGEIDAKSPTFDDFPNLHRNSLLSDQKMGPAFQAPEVHDISELGMAVSCQDSYFSLIPMTLLSPLEEDSPTTLRFHGMQVLVVSLDSFLAASAVSSNGSCSASS